MKKTTALILALIGGAIGIVCVAPAKIFVNGVEQIVSVNDIIQDNNVTAISNHLDTLQSQYTASSNDINGLSLTQSLVIASVDSISNHLDFLQASYDYTSNLVENISNVVQEISILELSNRIDGLSTTQNLIIASVDSISNHLDSLQNSYNYTSNLVENISNVVQEISIINLSNRVDALTLGLDAVSNHLDTLQGQYLVSSNYIDGLSITQGLLIVSLDSVSNHLDTLQDQYTVSSNYIDGLSVTQGLLIVSLDSVSNHLDTLQDQYTVSSNYIDGLSVTQGLVIVGAASVSNHVDTLQSQYTVSSNYIDGLSTTQGIVIANQVSISNHLDTLQSQYTASSNLAASAFLKQILTNGSIISTNSLVVPGITYAITSTTNTPLVVGRQGSNGELYGAHVDQTMITFATGHAGTNAGTGYGSVGRKDPSFVYNAEFYNGASTFTNYDLMGFDFTGDRENAGIYVRGDQSASLATIRTNVAYKSEYVSIYSPNGQPNDTAARSCAFGQVPGTEADFGILGERSLATPRYVLYTKVNPGGNISALYLGGDTNAYNVATTMRGNLIVGTNYVVGNTSSNGTRWINDGGTNVFQIFQGDTVGYEVRF